MASILVGDIDHKREERIEAQRHYIGDTCELIDQKHGNERVIVERIDGPYFHTRSDRSDAFLYYVYAPGRNIRYPAKGKSLRRVSG